MKERVLDVQRFLEHSFKEQKYIEPSSRFDLNKEHLLDVINTYNPEVIVKACVGGGELLAEIAKATKGRVVVVDPSISIIRKYINEFGRADNLQFIVGDFNAFPVDYYAADMIISIDNINFVESSSAVDEFRRALQFDGVLYIASSVLNEQDEEGIFDDYMRLLFPLHNEFYMAVELKTVLELNEFSFIKGTTESSKESVGEQSKFFSGIYENREEDCLKLIEAEKDVFASCYDFNDGAFTMPYYIGIFMRIKPDYVFEKPTASSL